jgi:uncharacterized protein YijF (DUF1287 family)
MYEPLEVSRCKKCEKVIAEPKCMHAVPMSIVRQFNLKAGDKISWRLDAKNGEIIIIVHPVKVSKESVSNAEN